MGTELNNILTGIGAERHRHLWVNLANDVVKMLLPVDSKDNELTWDIIRSHYELTETELVEIIQDPHFQNILKEKQKVVAALGDSAPAVVRARDIAASMLESIYHLGMDANTAPAVRVKIFELVANVGLLNPSTNGHNRRDEGGGGGGGAAVAQVIIQLPPGIPGVTATMAPIDVPSRVLRQEGTDGE